jgi:hypothetical protein
MSTDGPAYTEQEIAALKAERDRLVIIADAIQAERDRLRAALEEIVKMEGYADYERQCDIARRVLDGERSSAKSSA